MSVFTLLGRFLPRNAEPVKPDPMVQVGVKEDGTFFLLLPANSNLRGVRLVTIPASLAGRYESARVEASLVRAAIAHYPRSLRPRKRKPLKKAESVSE